MNTTWYYISYLWILRMSMIHLISQVLCNIFIELTTLMKLFKLLIMCLNETCGKVWEGKHLCDIFPVHKNLKQGDALLPLHLKFALEHVIKKSK